MCKRIELSKRILLISISCASLCSFAQSKITTHANPLSVQTGFSLKATMELGFSPDDPKPVIRVSGNAGVGSDFATTWLYPAFNIEVDLYNGGMGSRSTKNVLRSFDDLDVVLAFTVTAGTKNKLKPADYLAVVERNAPLYYFSDMVLPALKNPFEASVSIGTNLIFTPINDEKKKQRVGFLNGHYKRFQLSYFNDGGVPVSDIYLGDREDKNYTGGVLFSYHLRPDAAISLVELSYQKFTGYTKNAFEISNNLLLNFMNYHNPIQQKYNKSLWSLNVGNPNRGWAAKLSNYNSVKADVQHYIHWGLYNTYHMVTYQPHWAISGSYYAGQTKIGLR